MSYFDSIILGLVQGLAEFLPISSSGHLALLQYFFEIREDKVMMFTVMLHFGTLVSVFIVYWNDIWELIKELFITIGDLIKGNGLRMEERPVRKLGIMIIITTVPTAFIGLLLNNVFEKMNSNLIVIGVGFLITGFLMYLSEKISVSKKDIHSMNCRNAFFIGILQSIAMIPGISRSGSTLVGGLTTGLKREFAVKYAFLISIPSILGSFLVELPDALKSETSVQALGPITVGVVVAAVSGLIAIKTMIKLVSNKKLSYFSYYVWVLGSFTLIYGMFFA